MTCSRVHVAETFPDGRIQTVGRKECPCGEMDLRVIDATDFDGLGG